jgi:hypothetical protein
MTTPTTTPMTMPVTTAARRRAAWTFIVERVERHPKDAFPTEAVYRRTPAPVLRLVTCGGEFDRSTRHYLDNVVVFASLVA